MNIPRVTATCSACIALAVWGSWGCAKRKAARPSASATSTAALGLPAGPVARPAGTTTTFHVRTTVVPLGTVVYDGRVLPLVSPDGRFLGVQEGDAPSWPALLAEPGADAPASTRLRAYDLSTVPLKRVEWANPPPLGLLLGRAADNDGFLVEGPRENGDRWIGKVAWTGGSLQWLVQDPGVNAHATLTADGALLYTRRAAPDSEAELVRWRPGSPATVLLESSASFLYPLTTTEPGLAYALIQSRNSIDVAAIRWSAKTGTIISRRTLSASSDRSLGYQIIAPAQAFGVPDGPIAVYHPGLRRMAAFEPGEGRLTALAQGSVGASYWSRAGRPGFFCTSPGGLVFTPLPTPQEIETLRPRPPDARVLASPSIIRVSQNPDRPLVLIGPDARDPHRLHITLMHLDGEALPSR